MIAYFGNTLNRHQSYVSDELYKLTKGAYIYVETVPPRPYNNYGGKIKIERSYVLPAYKDKNNLEEARRLARESDVALFGAESFEYELIRMSLSHPGLAFDVSERWLKRGWINVFSPKLLRFLWHYHTKGWKKKPLYKLCSSAYGAGDQYRFCTFRDRCFKWGYFIEAGQNAPVVDLAVSTNKTINILWCGRFLKWKHPDLVILLARKLKDSGYNVNVNMYGEGAEKEKISVLCTKLNVGDIVSLKGNVSRDEILHVMRNHDIFLFTSDRFEGWGVVLNEAMGNACSVVASDAIGSVPFIIHNEENGLIFKSGDLMSLYEKTTYLIDNPDKRMRMAYNAYNSIRELWSPQVAAEHLLMLIEKLKTSDNESILNGPCSKAIPLM